MATKRIRHGFSDSVEVFQLQNVGVTQWLLVAAAAWFVFSTFKLLGFAGFDSEVAKAVARDAPLSGLAIHSFIELVVLGGPLLLLVVWRLVWSVPREVRNSAPGVLWIWGAMVGGLLWLELAPLFLVLVALVVFVLHLVLTRRWPLKELTAREEAFLLLSSLIFLGWVSIANSNNWLPQEVLAIEESRAISGFVLKSDGDWMTILTTDRSVLTLRSSSVESRTVCRESNRPSWSRSVLHVREFPILPVCDSLMKTLLIRDAPPGPS